MESTVSKKIKFSRMISIIFAVTSLIYVIAVIGYFVAMIVTLMTGSEYDMLGFVFGVFALPIALVLLLIPICRIITLMLSIHLNKKMQSGNNAAGLCTATGVLQIIDAVVTMFVFGFISLIPSLFMDPEQSLLAFLDILLGLFLFAVAAAKIVLQIISAISLFKIKKQM